VLVRKGFVNVPGGRANDLIWRLDPPSFFFFFFCFFFFFNVSFDLAPSSFGLGEIVEGEQLTTRGGTIFVEKRLSRCSGERGSQGMSAGKPVAPAKGRILWPSRRSF